MIPQEDWIDYLVKYPDIFSTNYCGYWARGVEQNDTGWLVWEDDEKTDHGKEPNREAAIQAWERGAGLPFGWYRLDEAAAIKAFEEGCKRWGVNWFEGEHNDAIGYDVVIQLALLGEIRYG